jgi:hypothetical protein
MTFSAERRLRRGPWSHRLLVVFNDGWENTIDCWLG